jgi:hypothetical protein
LGRRYNGANEAEVHKWFRAAYYTHPTPEAENYFAGLMSEAENTAIAEGLPYALFALVQHNLSLIYDNVPRSVLSDNRLDFDAWYPLPRRLPGLVKFMLTHRPSRERARRTLDAVRERFDVRCGLLESGAGVGREPVEK